MSSDKTERYPYSFIRDFARSQRNLDESTPLDVQAVKQDYFLSDRVQGRVDLVWRFNDDFLSEHSNAPALAFQSLESEPEDEDTMYKLVYLDPSLASSWQNEIDRTEEQR
jgi:hypothetical protein